MRNQRAHQISEKDGKQEGNQGLPRGVEKAQAEREQQHCDQDPRRSCIRQWQNFYPVNTVSNLAQHCLF